MKKRKRHGRRRANRGTWSKADRIALFRWKYSGLPKRCWKSMSMSTAWGITMRVWFEQLRKFGERQQALMAIEAQRMAELLGLAPKAARP